MSNGIVYLVGAGPGDYKLMTIKGIECIKQAEVIIYDRLVDERLLTYALPAAELIYVGKAASDHTMPQENINKLLVEKASTGKLVVRLKGGDPFVFGRGGEEAMALEAAGIAYEIVPGVTSAIAVPAYAGIPVTHRGVATSFAVVTGHEDFSKPGSTVDWKRLALGPDTIVFLMGMENLPIITANLIDNGLPADTPTAIIRWGTRPNQQTVVTSLGEAAQAVERNQLKPPAVIVVGQVVKLREKLAWFDQRPLFGKTVVITRTREQASELAAALEALGAECIEAPAIKIMPPDSFQELDAAIGRIDTYDWLIFTSVNGVRYFFERLYFLGKDARALAGKKIAAIGARTADRIQQHGINADIVPLEFRAEGVISALTPHIQPGMKVLIPRAAVARDILPTKLAELGAGVDVVTAYQTVSSNAGTDELKRRIKAGEVDLVTFTSSSTVTNFIDLLGAEAVNLIQKTQVACIGPITAATCLEKGICPAIVAEEYTIAGLVAAIDNFYKEG
jgi:uroporphyrinogen III methyltransferase/synthase